MVGRARIPVAAGVKAPPLPAPPVPFRSRAREFIARTRVPSASPATRDAPSDEQPGTDAGFAV